jgi:ABC-2 type transport system ATP-binding protein
MSAKSCELRTVMVMNISSESHQIAISVRDLIVDYKQLRAVNNISFDAKAGEVTVVIGPNGAGKTSTMEVCSGVRTATSGKVSVLGLDPKKDRSQINSQIGVMLQDGGVYPSARVFEIAQHYCNLYNNRTTANELLDAVDLSRQKKTSWRKLSGGEKQRLSLALALAAKPRIAFLDEPTSGVDIFGRDLIRRIVRQLASDGCAVIMATHELDEAQRVADHVLMFHNGSLVANAPVTELLNSAGENQKLEDIFRSFAANSPMSKLRDAQ